MARIGYLGIDVGTTNLKVALVEGDGRTAAEVSSEYEVSYSQSGRAEQDPEMWWQHLLQNLKQLHNNLDEDIELEGACVSGQMHGLIILDAEDRVLRPCMLWNDQRSMPQCERILSEHGEAGIIRETNNGLLPGYTLPKLVWLREHEPENFNRIQHVLLPKDYLRYRLTGRMATDFGDASGTG